MKVHLSAILKLGSTGQCFIQILTGMSPVGKNLKDIWLRTPESIGVDLETMKEGHDFFVYLAKKNDYF